MSDLPNTQATGHELPIESFDALAVDTYEWVTRLAPGRLKRAFVSAVVMIALAWMVNVLEVPNPNMILISGLVVCSALFGFSGGLTAASVMMVYTLAFFSEGHDFVTFEGQNLTKVVVSTIGITVVTAFVCTLRTAERHAFDKLSHASGRIRHDNELLKIASTTDTLTTTRNRYALRRDFERYVQDANELCVLMLDVDNFKGINDTYGHEYGDQVLSATGRALVGCLGASCVYRYGGDEFLAIIDMAEGWDVCRVKVQEVQERLSGLHVGIEEETLSFSGGFATGRVEHEEDLREMLRRSDEHLYEAKRAGKNRFVGDDGWQPQA